MIQIVKLFWKLVFAATCAKTKIRYYDPYKFIECSFVYAPYIPLQVSNLDTSKLQKKRKTTIP